MTYDVKCYELAEHFLDEVAGATEADKIELAKVIQQACEDACTEVERLRGADLIERIRRECPVDTDVED